MPELIPIILLGAYLWSKLDERKQFKKAYQLARDIFKERMGSDLDTEVLKRLHLKLPKKPSKFSVKALFKRLHR